MRTKRTNGLSVAFFCLMIIVFSAVWSGSASATPVAKAASPQPVASALCSGEGLLAYAPSTQDRSKQITLALLFGTAVIILMRKDTV